MDHLTLASFNCQSVRAHVTDVQELTQSADVICLQETWLPKQEQPFLGTINDNMGVANLLKMNEV